MVTISDVEINSPAWKAGIKPGESLLSINGHDINDVLDYRFFSAEKKLTLILQANSVSRTLDIVKPRYDDLGVVFESYLIDKKKCCKNNCVFCFIDQNPSGMRQGIYFKDDDERLSFLQGNYITLTNLSQTDIDRICLMHISPINISVHTMNRALRIKMMRNKNAAASLDYLQILSEHNIALNAQLVLCRGINDGKELEYSLNELFKLSSLQSIAVVPAGLTKHRDGLYQLMGYDEKSASDVIDIVEAFAELHYNQTGTRACYAADEFYLTAHRPIPQEDYYEDYPQLENGVGMLRTHREEFLFELSQTDTIGALSRCTIATGKAAYEHIRQLVAAATEKFPTLDCNVVAIDNNFFGQSITVSGLIVGSDIVQQLSGRDLGQRLLLPCNMLRYERDMFLDNMTLDELEERLKVTVTVTEKDGASLCRELLNT